MENKTFIDNLHSGMKPSNAKVQLHIPRSMIWILYLERGAQKIQGIKTANIGDYYVSHTYQLNRTSSSYHVGNEK